MGSKLVEYLIAFGIGAVATIVTWALWVVSRKPPAGESIAPRPEEVARRVERDLKTEADLRATQSRDPVDRANEAIDRLRAGSKP
jgi:hypothetical protein